MKENNDDSNINVEEVEHPTESVSSSSEIHTVISTDKDELYSNTDSDKSVTESDIDGVDIGNFLKCTGIQLDDLAKERALKHPWMPPKDFVFPVSGKRNLAFLFKWFKLYPWLVYSKRTGGAFCKICVLFARPCGFRGDQLLSALVTSAYIN